MLQFTNTYNIYGFQESFDKVNRNILFEILKNNQVQNQLIKAIYNIHKMNFIAVKVGKEYSEWKSVNQGVCHGCSLSSPYEWHDQKMPAVPPSSININRNTKSDTSLHFTSLLADGWLNVKHTTYKTQLRNLAWEFQRWRQKFFFSSGERSTKSYWTR